MSEIIRDISELAPNAQIACRLFLKKCEDENLKVRITETYRTQERQNKLYEQGRSEPGNIVTWTKNSRHTARRAWDICQNIKGREYSDTEFFISCGKVAESIGIIWGGNWKNRDITHFEVTKNWREPGMNEEEKREFEYYKDVIDRLADRINKLENPMIYNYIDENMPNWAKPAIEKMVEKKILLGDDDGKLDLTYDMLRIFTILDRTGIFN